MSACVSPAPVPQKPRRRDHGPKHSACTGHGHTIGRMRSARFEEPSDRAAGSEHGLRWNVKEQQHRDDDDGTQRRKDEEEDHKEGGVSTSAHALRL